MARGEGQRADTKWSFSNAFEGVTKLFGVKKEPQPEPEPDIERFSVLDGLKNTEKKKLIGTYNYLSEWDQEKGREDISAHIIEILADEIGNKELAMDELNELAWLLVLELRDRPVDTGKGKKKSAKKDPYEVEMNQRREADRMSMLVDRVGRLTKNYLGEQETSRKLTVEEKARLEPDTLEVQSTRIAEKIRKAPSKFDRGLSVYMGGANADLAKKEQDFLTKKRVALDKDAIKKILRLHPNNYEEAAAGYEEVFARAGLLEANGMAQEAGIARNLGITFSPIDGATLQNPDERLTYIESLMNPEPMMAKWRAEKPPDFNKEWAAEFVSNEVIPELLAQKIPFEEVVKQMQWFQVAGSYEQKDAWKVFKCDMAGKYRKIHVSVSNYPGPDQEIVPDMMAKLAAQVELFSEQIEAMRASEPEESFEEKVHQFASDVLHKFTAIHPMVDGNGRTGRSLREYIIAKHLGLEKASQYKGARDISGTHEKLLSHLRFGQPEITRSQMDTYFGSDLSTNYRAVTAEEERRNVGIWHEPLMAHLGATDIRDEVFANPKIVEFAKRAKDIIDGKIKHPYANY